MKIGAVLAAMLVLTTGALAESSEDFAAALSSILAAEQPCGLSYDQPAITKLIEERVAADDQSFTATLDLMTAGRGVDIDEMSASQKTAFCTQSKRVAQSFGLIR